MFGELRRMVIARFAEGIVLFWVFVCAPEALPAPASADVPACTVIPVELLDTLDSGKVHVGDHFHFRSLDTVVTHDQVTIEKGTIGYGLITWVQAAGAHAKAGELMPEARYFALPERRQYQVTIDYNASHKGSNRDAPGIVGAAPVPFLGVAVGAFNYLHAGANVVVPKGFVFAVMPVGSLGGETQCMEVEPNMGAPLPEPSATAKG
jgi:hypothetical protein